ncbi:MAG: hypothetical protein V9E94_14515 [Microthrixaceae bacterium]
MPGLSENITVRSIVGRYLEHSRIYRFANGRGPGRELHFIGSADLMPRNLDRRVEAVVPVRSPELRVRMDEILAVSLADDTLAWEQIDDRWTHVARRNTVETHLEQQEHALKRAEVGRR